MGCFAKKLTELVFPANKAFKQYHHQRKRLFDDIYGYDNIKRLFRMALDSIHPTFDNTVKLLTSGQHNIDEEIAKATVDKVWNMTKSKSSILITTSKIAKKTKNLRNKPILYLAFSILFSSSINEWLCFY
jgi:hypothetical protein